MSEKELALIVKRLRERYMAAKRSVKTQRRYDLQKIAQGRMEAYELALRLHGASCVTESTGGSGETHPR